MSFERRQFALEGSFSRELERQALAKHAEKLGLTLEPAQLGSAVPTTHIVSRPAAEQTYRHVAGAFPAPYTPSLLARPQSQLGSQVSFGRARWDVDGTSIFSVASGKELAQQPVRQISHYETQRAKRVRAAQWESPTVKGMRLLPTFTPGRALLWGTILAFWGSSACVLSGMRALGIEKGDDVGEKLRGVMTPYAAAVAERFEPVRAMYESSGGQHLERPSTLASLATALKRNLTPS